MGFAQNLKAARKTLKLTQQEIADELGIDRSAIDIMKRELPCRMQGT